MKLALIGVGKTGGKVLEQYSLATVFNTSNPPTLEKLKEHDIILSFLPGNAFVEYIPLLLKTGLPVVTGSTGFDFPKDFRPQSPWIHATNFSLGMNVAKQMIKLAAKAKALFPETEFSIHEVHHTKKLDAPSGTALSWREWLGHDCEITSTREGDIIGLHELTVKMPNEEIFLSHNAKDRGIFAAGALWACRYLLNHKLDTKLYQFSEIVEQELQA